MPGISFLRFSSKDFNVSSLYRAVRIRDLLCSLLLPFLLESSLNRHPNPLSTQLSTSDAFLHACNRVSEPAVAQQTPVHACVRVCVPVNCGFHLEQQLVLHDPLDGLDEQVVELQPVAQLQP